MAANFKNHPVQGDIITNHLKDFKLSALNMQLTKEHFERDVTEMINISNCFFENNKILIKKFRETSIEAVFIENINKVCY